MRAFGRSRPRARAGSPAPCHPPPRRRFAIPSSSPTPVTRLPGRHALSLPDELLRVFVRTRVNPSRPSPCRQNLRAQRRLVNRRRRLPDTRWSCLRLGTYGGFRWRSVPPPTRRRPPAWRRCGPLCCRLPAGFSARYPSSPLMRRPSYRSARPNPHDPRTPHRQTW